MNGDKLCAESVEPSAAQQESAQPLVAVSEEAVAETAVTTPATSGVVVHGPEVVNTIRTVQANVSIYHQDQLTPFLDSLKKLTPTEITLLCSQAKIMFI